VGEEPTPGEANADVIRDAADRSTRSGLRSAWLTAEAATSDCHERHRRECVRGRGAVSFRATEAAAGWARDEVRGFEERASEPRGAARVAEEKEQAM